ncbi:MAG: phosphoglycerate dehydrogenase [Defluviicoccus sp.]|nr:phosphoglycerate dehydrogenase [Defluviicoccus sp.]MDE0383729.1 phosphoglycerate dehydrogenase [Defluviicoccus sp.]
MNRVLISDRLSERAVGIFGERGIDVDFDPGLASEALLERIGAYDGLAVRSATRVTSSVIAAGERLRVIGRAGIGVDNIDVPAASARGVVVMNTPFGNAVTTAEHAIALMFALARQIPAADRETQSGAWDRARFLGTELAGKTLGIVGCGSVGSVVADRAQGLKMRVLVHDPYLAAERAERLGVARVALDELLERSDVISLHVPLTDRTRGILGEAALAKTRPGVRIVNCARGELVDAHALADALSSGHVGGVAVDVYPEEPPGDYPLFGMEGVIATPHLGASTAEAQENVAVQIAEQMSDYLLDGAVLHAVNMPSFSSEESARLAPFMDLARQIGSLAGQVAETGFRAVVVEYDGEAAELNPQPMTASLLEGLLAPIVDSVNIVNAPIVARERGIQVTETKHARRSDYPSLIRLTVTTERATRTTAGTLFSNRMPRIVELDGIPLEASLASNMLYMVNRDEPGFIGRLGSCLGDAGVNIATFHLGRSGPRENAVSLISVDGTIPPSVLDCVRALPGVVRARALSF